MANRSTAAAVSEWFESRRAFALAVGLIILAYGIPISYLVQTRLPWIDEAWVANPAWNLLEHDRMVTSFFESANPDSNQPFSKATYWMPPGWFILEAGWFSVFGTGLIQQRLLSALFGALLLVSLYSLSSRLTGSKRIGLLACSFTAIDFVFLNHAADGRMDVAAAAAIMATYALYLRGRETHLTGALLAANAMLVVAGLIHPIAIVGCGGLLCLVILLDRSRLRWSHLTWVITPYAIGAAAWGFYIAHDPSAFIHQFFGKTPAPNFGFLRAFGEEIYSRYRHIFGLNQDWNIASYPQFTVGVSYAGAAAIAVIATVWLRNARWGRPTLLWLSHFIGLTMIISLKADYHLPSIIPLYALLLATTVDALMNSKRGLPFAVALLLVIAACDLRIVIRRIQIDPYARYFAPTLAAVKAVPSSELVSAPPEFAYALGFPPHVLHDYFFGFYSGRKPSLIVSRQNIVTANSVAQRSAEQNYIKELFEQEYYLDRTIGIYHLYRPQKKSQARAADESAVTIVPGR